MDRRTVQALNRLNRAFYRKVGEEFSATRRAPWPGWERLLPYLSALPDPLAVLDVGCGNGRFGAFVAHRLGRPFRYVGVDADPALLRHAREALAPRVADLALLRRDVVASPLRLRPDGETFSLVAAFGLLHHVPGAATRRRLVEALAERVRPGGLLALVAWRFGARARFRRRVVGWQSYNRTATERIDEAKLEPGDLLLRWGTGSSLRYCHDLAPEALAALVRGLPLAAVEAYAADGEGGDLNRYLLLRRPQGA
jgi:tRNA (uracil-5-)-methyltransferase TRM9